MAFGNITYHESKQLLVNTSNYTINLKINEVESESKTQIFD